VPQVFETASGTLNHSLGQETRVSPMFVRKVSTLLKPDSISKFSLIMEQEVIPMLRKQDGFQDELTFFAPSQDAVTSISLWDKASDAEAFNQRTFPDVLKMLAALIEGTPKVDTYEVLNSTFHKIAAAVAA
jgi:hypothetical protein